VIVVTGSSGHLGEALIRVLRSAQLDVVGVDVRDSPFTTVVGSILDRRCIRRCLQGADAIVHTATLHRPHVDSRRRRDFVDVNVTGTLVLLEAAVASGVRRFVFTRRASSPSPISTTTSGRATTTRTSRSTSCCTGASTSRMS